MPEEKPATPAPAEKPADKKPEKAKPTKFDEERELKVRMDKLIALARQRRKTEQQESDAAEAHKSAKNRLDAIHEESDQIIDECDAIENGTFQKHLPMDMGGKGVDRTGFDKLDSEKRGAAERALAGALKRKVGLSPTGMAKTLFGQATKDFKASALEVLELMVKAGLVERAESGKKEPVFWPVKPAKPAKEPKETKTASAAG